MCCVQNGRGAYLGMIRHVDVEQCAVGALARYIWMRFVLYKAEFPDPANEAQWYVQRCSSK